MHSIALARFKKLDNYLLFDNLVATNKLLDNVCNNFFK